MGVVSLALELDRCQGGISPGGRVSGVVTVTLGSSKLDESVVVRVQGTGRVRWTAPGKARYHQGKETYMQEDIVLMTGDSCPLVNPIKLPFSYQLPLNIPSSFDGKHGYIRYVACAGIARPWVLDHAVEKEFRVTGALDLNQSPRYKQGVYAEGYKHLCCLWCQSGPIVATVRLSRSGYVPGETIVVEAEVDNGSTSEASVHAVLRQVVVYHARDALFPEDNTIVTDTELAKVPRSVLFPKESVVWSGEKLRIDRSLPPTDLAGHCRLIRIRYELVVIVSPSGPSGKLHIRLPITIGTIPLQQCAQPQQSLSRNEIKKQQPNQKS